MSDSHVKITSVPSENAACFMCGFGMSKEKGAGFTPGYLCISGLMKHLFGERREVRHEHSVLGRDVSVHL